MGLREVGRGRGCAPGLSQVPAEAKTWSLPSMCGQGSRRLRAGPRGWSSALAPQPPASPASRRHPEGVLPGIRSRVRRALDRDSLHPPMRLKRQPRRSAPSTKPGLRAPTATAQRCWCFRQFPWADLPWTQHVLAPIRPFVKTQTFCYSFVSNENVNVSPRSHHVDLVVRAATEPL